VISKIQTGDEMASHDENLGAGRNKGPNLVLKIGSQGNFTPSTQIGDETGV
jgi:hypothetical protein